MTHWPPSIVIILKSIPLDLTSSKAIFQISPFQLVCTLGVWCSFQFLGIKSSKTITPSSFITSSEFSKSFLLKVLATDDENERSKLIYGLKNQVAKAGKYVGEEAVQLHGGMGVTEEMSVGHYLKRLLVITNLFGSADYFLDKYIES